MRRIRASIPGASRGARPNESDARAQDRIGPALPTASARSRRDVQGTDPSRGGLAIDASSARPSTPATLIATPAGDLDLDAGRPIADRIADRLLHAEQFVTVLLARLGAHPWVAAAITIGLLWSAAFLVRVLFLDRSFDVFIDEVSYLQVSQNVMSGHGVSLAGKPFFLHPPLFFFIEGVFVTLFEQGKLLIDQVQSVRILNAILAGFTGTALFAIASRVAGWRVGLVAFAFFALDPFIIKINSRNLLETSALLWVILGYLILVWRRLDGSSALGLRRLAAAGLLFGFAILTKEMTAFLTLLPLGVAFVTRWFMPRRQAALLLAIAFSTYCVYPFAIILSGLGPEFFGQKLDGLLRFLGVVKTTGFVQAGGPSFSAAVIRNLDVFATTYVLIALGIPACVVLLTSVDRRRRLLGVLGASAYALLAYSVTLGTLEEQFFYFLILPAYLSVPIAWALVVPLLQRSSRLVHWSRLTLSLRRSAGAMRALGPVALAISLAWSSLIWFQLHLSADNGYEQLLQYMHRVVPYGTPIGVTTEPQEFLLQGYVIEHLGSDKDLIRSRVDYAVVSTKQIDDGYVTNGREIYAWLLANGQRVFVVQERTYGRIELFSLRDATAALARTGPALPAVSRIMPVSGGE